MAFFERFQRGHDGLRRLGTIDAAKRLGDWLAVLPGRKAHALSDQMHSLDTQWRGTAPTGHGRRAGSGSTRRPAARSSVPPCRREVRSSDGDRKNVVEGKRGYVREN